MYEQLQAGTAHLFKPFANCLFVKGYGGFPFAHRANNTRLMSAAGQSGSFAAEHTLKLRFMLVNNCIQ